MPIMLHAQVVSPHPPYPVPRSPISPSRSRVHDGLARLLAEGILKVLAVVGVEVVAGHGLAAVLVDALQHLVAGGVPEAGEQREELPRNRCVGLVLEDDGVEVRRGPDLLNHRSRQPRPVLSGLSLLEGNEG